MKEFGAEESAVPLKEYGENVRRILTTLKSETGAAVLWAMTTPVNENRHHENKPFDRLEADVDAYNEVATRTATELDVPVSDLFDLIQQAGRDQLLLADGVHFTPEGSELLGKAVAKFIRAQLA